MYARDRLFPAAAIAVLLPLVSAGSGLSRVARAEETILHVAPRLQPAEEDGSAEKPFATIARALELAPARSVIRLAAGVYSPTSNGETFPIESRIAGDISVVGPPDGEARLEAGSEDAILAVTMLGTQGRFRLQGVEMAGGRTGITVVGGNGAEFGVELAGNAFTGQRYQAAEVVAGEGGRATATVRGNTIRGGPIFGIDLGTQPGGRLEVAVEDNRIEDLPPSGTPPIVSQPLRYGIALYLDIGAAVTGTIDRNVILNVPVGILALEEEYDEGRGTVDVTVANCLIAGDPAPDRNNLRHGYYLALWPHHATGLKIANCTVANASGYGIFEESPSDWGNREADTSLEVVRSIFWNASAGEFSQEAGGAPLPPRYRRIADNILPASARGSMDGNSRLDPLLDASLAPAAGSPAIDAGPALGLDLTGPRDARGACRVMDGDGDGLYRIDVGAIEAAGPCREDAKQFKRGDCDGSGELDLSDPMLALRFLFLGGERPACADACDCDDDGSVDITDAIAILSYLFLGSDPPRPPFPAPGFDATPDGLGACE